MPANLDTLPKDLIITILNFIAKSSTKPANFPLNFALVNKVCKNATKQFTILEDFKKIGIELLDLPNEQQYSRTVILEIEQELLKLAGKIIRRELLDETEFEQLSSKYLNKSGKPNDAISAFVMTYVYMAKGNIRQTLEICKENKEKIKNYELLLNVLPKIKKCIEEEREKKESSPQHFTNLSFLASAENYTLPYKKESLGRYTLPFLDYALAVLQPINLDLAKTIIRLGKDYKYTADIMIGYPELIKHLPEIKKAAFSCNIIQANPLFPSFSVELGNNLKALLTYPIEIIVFIFEIIEEMNEPPQSYFVGNKFTISDFINEAITFFDNIFETKKGNSSVNTIIVDQILKDVIRMSEYRKNSYIIRIYNCMKLLNSLLKEEWFNLSMIKTKMNLPITSIEDDKSASFMMLSCIYAYFGRENFYENSPVYIILKYFSIPSIYSIILGCSNPKSFKELLTVCKNDTKKNGLISKKIKELFKSKYKDDNLKQDYLEKLLYKGNYLNLLFELIDGPNKRYTVKQLLNLGHEELNELQSLVESGKGSEIKCFERKKPMSQYAYQQSIFNNNNNNNNNNSNALNDKTPDSSEKSKNEAQETKNNSKKQKREDDNIDNDIPYKYNKNDPDEDGDADTDMFQFTG